ncbi:MAG: hypothetical protein ABII81_06750 [Pseudomonadota bacterium]
MRYRCPACDFPIFNRRVPRCESCGADLPQALLYSEQQIASIDAEFDKNKAQVDRLKRNMGVPGTSGGDSGGGDWGGSCGGDGGGGCD